MSRKKATLRVHVVELDDGRLLGTLIRTRESFFDTFPPAAYGPTLADVLAQLDRSLRALLAVRADELDRYLWKEKLGKADALWAAKSALRAEGHPLRDWAGWVLTGAPD